MGLELYLVRHAKSDWSEQGQKDFDRSLNARGHREAPKMGRFVADLGIKPDLILCSPAVRAKLTCEYFSEQMHFDLEQVEYVEDLYEASLRTLLRIINEFKGEYKRIMVFGHNPGFTYLAEYLTKAEIGNLPTCSIYGIGFETDNWAEISGATGSTLLYEYLKKKEDEAESED
jgi:phosphohistidine phosphatase